MASVGNACRPRATTAPAAARTATPKPRGAGHRACGRVARVPPVRAGTSTSPASTATCRPSTRRSAAGEARRRDAHGQPAFRAPTGRARNAGRAAQPARPHAAGVRGPGGQPLRQDGARVEADAHVARRRRRLRRLRPAAGPRRQGGDPGQALQEHRRGLGRARPLRHDAERRSEQGDSRDHQRVRPRRLQVRAGQADRTHRRQRLALPAGAKRHVRPDPPARRRGRRRRHGALLRPR